MSKTKLRRFVGVFLRVLQFVILVVLSRASESRQRERHTADANLLIAVLISAVYYQTHGGNALGQRSGRQRLVSGDTLCLAAETYAANDRPSTVADLILYLHLGKRFVNV